MKTLRSNYILFYYIHGSSNNYLMCQNYKFKINDLQLAMDKL